MTSILSRKREYLTQQLQVILSKKQNFSPFFTAFLKYAFHFEHLEKKVEPHSLCIYDIIHCERRAYVNV